MRLHTLPGFSIVLVTVLTSVSCQSITTPDRLNDRYREVLEQRMAEYRIKAGDSVTISFYNQPAITTQAMFVLPDGRSDMFFMDNVILADKTLAELQVEVEGVYKNQGVRDPEISIQIQPAGEFVYLEGMVGNAKTVPFALQMTLSQLMAEAGSYQITGSVDDIILRRSYLDATYPEKFRVNIYDDSEEIFLLPNDHIVVERTTWILVRDYLDEYLWGFVRPMTGFFFGLLAAAF